MEFKAKCNTLRWVSYFLKHVLLEKWYTISTTSKIMISSTYIKFVRFSSLLENTSTPQSICSRRLKKTIWLSWHQCSSFQACLHLPLFVSKQCTKSGQMFEVGFPLTKSPSDIYKKPGMEVPAGSLHHQLPNKENVLLNSYRKKTHVEKPLPN